MMKRAGLVVVVILCLAFSKAFAEELEKKEKIWTDEAELSFVDTNGNSNVTTIAGKNTLKVKFTDKLIGSWVLGALYSESDNVRSAERYFTDLKLDYLFTDQFYSYGGAGWLKDTFAGYDNRYYGGVGAGYKLFTGPKHFLLGEAGLAYYWDDYTNDTRDDYPVGRAFGSYAYAFTDKTRFSQTLEFLYDFEDSSNYNINSETAIITALNSFLSLKASYVVRYDHEPVPSTLRKTDTILAIGLLVTY